MTKVASASRFFGLNISNQTRELRGLHIGHRQFISDAYALSGGQFISDTGEIWYHQVDRKKRSDNYNYIVQQHER